MANGTHDEKLARADRIREQSLKAQQRAEQHRKATMNAINRLRELEPYREDMDSVSEVTIGTDGVKAKAPPWALLALGILALVAFVSWLVIRR